MIFSIIEDGLQMIVQQRMGQKESGEVAQKIDLLIAEVRTAMRDPATIDTYFTTQLLPLLMELFQVGPEELTPLGAILEERGVSSQALPSEWSPDDQRIVLEVLKEFLEGKAYAAAGETVPERVLREIGDLIADIRKRVNNKFPAAADPEPEVKISEIMYGLYTTLIKWGVPEDAMQRIGEVMAEEA